MIWLQLATVAIFVALTLIALGMAFIEWKPEYRHQGRHRGKYVVPPGITRQDRVGRYAYQEHWGEPGEMVYIGDMEWNGKYYGALFDGVGTINPADILSSRTEYNTFDNWNNDEWWAQR